MAYRQQVAGGLRYLSDIQNEDGGIPATKRGDVSGCWTSAETLEALCLSPYYPSDRAPLVTSLVAFLESTELPTGGWPLVVGSNRASAMASGHAVAALQAARGFFGPDAPLSVTVAGLAQRGLEWLGRTQGANGGWGVEPEGGQAGTDSRLIATVYALRGFVAYGLTTHASRHVREGATWIVSSLRSNDGGFAGHPGDVADPCSTARATTTLIRTGHLAPDHRIVKDAIRFILKAKPRRRLWDLDTETFVIEGAPGQTVFNSNTTADVLEAFLDVGLDHNVQGELIEWFTDHQLDDGSWMLGANNLMVPEIVTWATNEAVLALSSADEQYHDAAPHPRRRRTVPAVLFYSVMAAALVEALVLAGVPRGLWSTWYGFPDWVRQVILVGIILAIVVNLISQLIYDLFRRRREKS